MIDRNPSPSTSLLRSVPWRSSRASQFGSRFRAIRAERMEELQTPFKPQILGVEKNPWIQILCENQGEATWLLTRPMKLKTLSHQLHTKGWSSPGYTNCAILSVWDGLHSRVLTMVTCDEKGSPWNYWKHQWSENSSGGLENFWKPLYKSYEYYYLYIYSYLQIINNGYWSYVDQLIDFVAAGGAHIVANFGSRWHPGKVCPRITGSLQNA